MQREQIPMLKELLVKETGDRHWREVPDEEIFAVVEHCATLGEAAEEAAQYEPQRVPTRRRRKGTP